MTFYFNLLFYYIFLPLMMTNFSTVFKLLTEFKTELIVVSEATEISHMRMITPEASPILTTVMCRFPLEDVKELGM
jgi:hypothetical protein